MARQFTSAPAERKAQHLVLGIVGPSSSGKTYSALEMAMGIREVMGGEVVLIDTENGRGLAYADLKEFRKPDGSPGYQHVQFEPPFASLDYIEALKCAAKIAGPSGTVIVDSMSHEHESEGGMLDYQDQELTRMAGTDNAKRERMQMLAWAKPKAARRKLLQAITRLNCNVILCFRAKNTSKPAKEKWTSDDGTRSGTKNVVIPMGFVPIAGDEFVFEMALSALLLPGAKGVPTWEPEFPGEKMAVKVPKHFDWVKSESGPLSRSLGRKMAEWARAGAAPKATRPKAAPIDPSDQIPDAPASDAPTALEQWADSLDADHGEIENAAQLHKAWSDTIKTERWGDFKETYPERAAEMVKARTSWIAKLKVG